MDLVAFRADPVPYEGGALVTWATNPGVGDLAGYRLEKAVGSGAFTSVLGLTSEVTYRDPGAIPGTQYRLTAVNGLGDAFVLGVATFRPRKPLAAGPLPYRGGDLTISFASSGGAAGAPALTEVILFDLRGRRVRTIARGPYPSGFQSAAWNGKDEGGRRVASGVYFLKTVSGGHEQSIKITVLR